MKHRSDRRLGTLGIVATTLVGAFVVPSAASALDPAPFVPVEVVACGDELPPLVRERLAVELEVLWRESPAPPEASVRAVIRCENDIARLEVTAPPEVSQSVVSLSGLDRDARARLLALKTTELIHLIGKRTWEKSSPEKGDGGASSASADASSSSDAAPPANAEQRAAPVDAASGKPISDRPAEGAPLRASQAESPTVSLGVLALFVGRPFTYLAGPAVAGQASLARRISIGGDIDGLFGSVHDADRVLHLRGAAGAASALLVANVGRAAFAVGAGGRIGLMQLSGEAGPNARVVGRSASGIWAGPMITGKVSYPLGVSRWLVEVAAEGGMVTLPLAGLVDKSPQFFALQGPWFGVRASLGLDLATR